MFIHLGGDTLVSSKMIVAIINAENALNANTTKDFLKRAQEKGMVKKLDNENFKSIIITEKNIYLSPISSLTLKKRASFVANLA